MSGVLGTRLTIYDLMRAATWSPDFDLGNTVDDLKSTLEPKKFDTLENKTFLRTLAAAAGGDFSAQSIDALRELDNANQFAVLSEVFRLVPHPSAAQLAEIKRWFWLTTLSGYFGGWDSGQMTQDTRQIRAFAEGKAETLGEGGVIPSSALWRMKPFRSNSAVSKMLGLVLAHEAPLDLINGQRIDVDKSLAWSTKNITTSSRRLTFDG